MYQRCKYTKVQLKALFRKHIMEYLSYDKYEWSFNLKS